MLLLAVLLLSSCTTTNNNSQNKEPTYTNTVHINTNEESIAHYYDEVHKVGIWIVNVYYGGGIAVLPMGEFVNPTNLNLIIKGVHD
jgi:hypothetical protein